jgi:hypothetical protein
VLRPDKVYKGVERFINNMVPALAPDLPALVNAQGTGVAYVLLPGECDTL